MNFVSVLKILYPHPNPQVAKTHWQEKWRKKWEKRLMYPADFGWDSWPRKLPILSRCICCSRNIVNLSCVYMHRRT